MSKLFLQCVKIGGYIRTLQKKGNKYQHTCSIKGKIYKDKIKNKKN